MLELPPSDKAGSSLSARQQQTSWKRLPPPLPRPIHLEWIANRDYHTRRQTLLTQVDGQDSLSAFQMLSHVPCISVQNPFGAPWCYFSAGLGPDVSGIPIIIEIRAYSDCRQKMWIEYDSTDTEINVIPGEPGAFKRSEPVEAEAAVWRDYSFIINDLTCTKRINGSDFRVVCTQRANRPFYVHSVTVRRALSTDPKTHPFNLATELTEAVKTLYFDCPANPDVSIIIPFFGGLLFTQQCLLYLRQNTLENFEVILVDDGSPVEVSTALRSIPGIRLISNSENLGFSKACNKGASLARGSHLVFLNNDTIPQGHWLGKLLACSGRFPNAGVIGSKLLYPESKLVQHAGVAFHPNGNPYHEYRCFARNAPAVTKERLVPAVTGACMLTPRVVFERLDGFDETFKNGFEDFDYCLRARDLGKDIVYCPSSELLFYASVTEGLINIHQELVNLTKLKEKRVEKLQLKVPQELSRNLRSQVKSDYWKTILTSIENKNTEVILNELKRIDQKQGLFKLPHPFFENLDTWAVGSIREGMCNYIFFADKNHQQTWVMCQCTDFVDAIFSKEFSGKHQAAPADAVFHTAKGVFQRMAWDHQMKTNFNEHQELAGYRLDQQRPYHHFYDHLKWFIAINTRRDIKQTQSFYLPSTAGFRDPKNSKTIESHLFPAVIGSDQLGMVIDKHTLNMEAAIIRDIERQNPAGMKKSRITKHKHLTIWHGISAQKRIWVEQAELIPALVQELQCDYRSFTFIIDGYTDFDYCDLAGGEYETPKSVLEDQEIFRSIQSTMRDYKNVIVKSVIGMTYKEKIVACRDQVDFFIANAGAGQIVPHRFCKKRGILHSNQSHCVFPSGIQGNDRVRFIPKSNVKDVGNIFEEFKHQQGTGLVSYSIEPLFVARLAKSMLIERQAT